MISRRNFIKRTWKPAAFGILVPSYAVAQYLPHRRGAWRRGVADSFVGLTRYVNTASSAGGDGTTNGTAGATRAFASLREALDSLPGTLTQAVRIYCSGTAADTLSTVQANWDFVTSAANYIHVIGDNTTGVYSTSHYRIEVTNDAIIYNNYGSHIRIENLQGQVTINTSSGASYTGMRLMTANNQSANIDHRFINCIFKAVISGGATDNVYGFSDSNPVTFTGTTKRINCIAYGGYAGYTSDGSTFCRDNLYNYNCTAYGNEYNFIDLQKCLNCLAASAVNFDFVSTGTTGHSHNASTDGSAGGTSARTSQTFSFVNAGSGDFHLQAGDAGAKDFGLSDPASGLFSTDIDGQTRSGSWDIGADEQQ